MDTTIRSLIREILSERDSASSLIKKDVTKKLLQASQNNDNFGSWRSTRGKRGEIRLFPTSFISPNFNYLKFFQTAGLDAKEASASLSGKYTTWDVLTPSGTVQVVFAVASQKPGSSGKSQLNTAKTLGFAAEHAVYAAMNNTNNKVLKQNIENDSRISNAIVSSRPENVEKFFNDCIIMKNSVKSKFAQLGINAKADDIPDTGTDEYDLRSTSGDEKYFIHVKYKSDRLVGVPKSAKQTPKEAAKNPSSIYKLVRDSLLFKGGLKGGKNTLDPSTDMLNNDENLTAYGKRVLKKQTKLGESEIAAMVKDPSLQNVLYSKLKESNFDQSLLDSIKQQLGLEQKGDVSATTLFVNFKSPKNISTQMFLPMQGENVKLKLVPGSSTNKAFTVNATIKMPNNKNIRLNDVFNVELGSIKRAKYVQLHKGTNFSKFSEALKNLGA